jgi:hypothetical protein
MMRDDLDVMGDGLYHEDVKMIILHSLRVIGLELVYEPWKRFSLRPEARPGYGRVIYF